MIFVFPDREVVAGRTPSSSCRGGACTPHASRRRCAACSSTRPATPTTSLNPWRSHCTERCTAASRHKRQPSVPRGHCRNGRKAVARAPRLLAVCHPYFGLRWLLLCIDRSGRSRGHRGCRCHAKAAVWWCPRRPGRRIARKSAPQPPQRRSFPSVPGHPRPTTVNLSAGCGSLARPQTDRSGRTASPP